MTTHGKQGLWRLGGSLPLTFALIATFVLETASDASSWPLMLAHLVVLAGGAYALARDRRILAFSIVVLVPAALARAAFGVTPQWWTFFTVHVFTTLFLCIVAVTVFRRAVAEPGRVTKDRLAGAVSVYLLFGVIGAGFAVIIELLLPGSYAIPEVLLDTASPFLRTSGSTYVYFSFVTLATLGYGDVTPVSPQARTLAWMLAVTGQLYVAIVVARLVSLGFDDAGDSDHVDR